MWKDLKKKYTLEFTVFVCGAVVMVFELVGSRILGPYFGTSIFVWTTIIGIFLGSLSIGYFVGGKLADTRTSKSFLALLVLFAAACILLTLLVKDVLLLGLLESISDIRVTSIISGLVLFLPASIFLGTVSPYAAKLKLIDLEHSGEVIGKLYAISTAGSIVGTFFAGFYLIPTFGTNKILLILSIVLLGVAALLSGKGTRKVKGAAVLSFALMWVLLNAFQAFSQDVVGIVDVDTTYSRVWVYETEHETNGLPIKMMQINAENHSSMYTDSDELANEYSKYYHLADHFLPGFESALMFGGAGYSFPKDYLKQYPHATIDVVEIDPAVTELAREYFNLQDDPRLRIHHEDGRVYLNRNTQEYDVIFGDAFASQYSLPYQLTTQEAVSLQYDSLSDEGVAIVNLISSIGGSSSQFLRAEYATYASVFPHVYAFPVVDTADPDLIQNVMLVALKSTEKPSFVSDDPELQQYLGSLLTTPIPDDMPILTDDFAPVDYYISKTL